ncbi:MAG: beta-hydroxyacyl-ACP dehydratase [Leptospiraceae bacterium]|nr:beta-hydroxyacyl-ACP dehydratase [Leptospiraceae bacterium]MDW7975373.1 beta-hydroxyacyl-ACP dehydratase [Leptospiraceae bacterium]
MVVDFEIKKKILESIPQKPPFRFIEDIIELSDKHIVGKYTFKKNEYFYDGHFPNNPITPGVIILETMAQTGVVALGIYLEMLKNRPVDKITLFTEATVEFINMVLPEETIFIRGDLIYHRKNKIKSKVEVKKTEGTLVAVGELAGVAIS